LEFTSTRIDDFGSIFHLEFNAVPRFSKSARYSLQPPHLIAAACRETHRRPPRKLESLSDFVDGESEFKQRAKRAAFHDTIVTHHQKASKASRVSRHHYIPFSKSERSELRFTTPLWCSISKSSKSEQSELSFMTPLLSSSGSE
jgi:hypothetical protein